MEFQLSCINPKNDLAGSFLTVSSRGYSAPGHGGWWCHAQPVADPYAGQVLLRVGGVSGGQASLDGKHRELPGEANAGRLPAACLGLRRHLDPRQHLWAVPPLLCQVQRHYAPSPLPQVRLPGVRLVLEAQGGAPPHQPHREKEGLQAVLQWGEQGGGEAPPEVGQQREKLFRGGGWNVANTHHWEPVVGHLDDFLVWVPSTTTTVLNAFRRKFPPLQALNYCH